MILALSDLMSLATTLSGGRADMGVSEVSRLVNIAAQEVAQRAGHMPKEAIAVSSTTSGENRLTLPTDYDYALAVTLFQGSNSTATLSRTTLAVPLFGRDANWADSRDLPDGGVPANYVLFGTFIELYPSPNSAYSMQLRYMNKMPTLVASTDTPTLDDRWHPAIAFKSAELCAASRNDPEMEALARNRYLNYIVQIPTDLQLKQRDKASMTLRYTRNLLKDSQ